MYKLWGKTLKNNKIINSLVIDCTNDRLSDIEKRDYCLEKICYEFDLQVPSFFPANENEFKRYGKTSFREEHFIEYVDFDFLEIEVIDEDKL